jgi:hypothetical protein
MPAAVGQAVAHDFAVATQWVLYGMAIALAVSFLVSLAHPGGRAEARASGPAPEPVAAATDGGGAGSSGSPPPA